ncbi:uncharacterized protein LOC135488563 [Lineus longissimus]|uniref:uncharacterized protein LOC135488563 n=1 Tax=Lineus longissimus TaxID=88925 RepID=UPI00315C8B4C
MIYVDFLSIDATSEVCLARLVNDAKGRERNAKVQKMVTNGQPHLCLYSTKEIQKGDEVAYDYGEKDLEWRKEPGKTIDDIDSWRLFLIQLNHDISHAICVSQQGAEGVEQAKLFTRRTLSMIIQQIEATPEFLIGLENVPQLLLTFNECTKSHDEETRKSAEILLVKFKKSKNRPDSNNLEEANWNKDNEPDVETSMDSGHATESDGSTVGYDEHDDDDDSVKDPDYKQGPNDDLTDSDGDSESDTVIIENSADDEAMDCNEADDHHGEKRKAKKSVPRYRDGKSDIKRQCSDLENSADSVDMDLNEAAEDHVGEALKAKVKMQFAHITVPQHSDSKK